MQILIGTITALPTTATAQVKVERQWMHPTYKKTVRRDKTFACHLDKVQARVGDKVQIQPCRPISKTKRFVVIKVMQTEEKKS